MADGVGVGVGIGGLTVLLVVTDGCGAGVEDAGPSGDPVVEPLGVGDGDWVAWARASRWAMHSFDFWRSVAVIPRADSSEVAVMVARTCSW